MKRNTIRLLLVGVRDEEGAQLTSVFRRLGCASHFEKAQDNAQLAQAINQGSADLVLLNYDQSPIDAHGCAEQLRKSDRDIPLILVGPADNFPDIEGTDRVPEDDLERLAHSCLREFHALETRRELTELREKLRQAEERNALLLSQSDDAIAYVADGMIISVNERFAATFGYDSPDELDCLPMVDLMDAGDQERLKNALKNQNGESTRISVKALAADDNAFPVTLALQRSTYDDEECVQISVHGASVDGGTVSAVDAVTGLASEPSFLEELDDVVNHGLSGGAHGMLLMVSLDRYHVLRGQLGLNEIQLLMTDLSELLRAELPDIYLGRTGDDLVAGILRDMSEEEALKLAKSLCRKAEGRIVELDEQSQQYTVSIGITPITPLNAPNASHLLGLAFGTCGSIRDAGGGNGAGNDAAVYVRQRQRLKRTDRNTFHLFEEARADERLQLLFQPLVSLAEDEGDHYEVLLDLQDREEDEISGMEMLASIEQQGGGNTELDRWIIVESTKRLAETHKSNPNTRLIINLTCNVFQDKSLLPWLKVALRAAGLPARSLVFQFDANYVGNYLKQARDFAVQLRELGCLLAIHGRSDSAEEAQALRQLAPTFVKIDNALAGGKQLSTEELREAIDAIRAHGAKAIVPSVNSAATLASLWQMQPDYIQGAYVHEASTEMDYEFADIA